jgi:hypothetical protein
MPSPISGEMTARNQVQVHVNAELVLNAGTCEEIAGPHPRELLIHPPGTTLFHQVLAYLQAKPNPPNLMFRLNGRPRRCCCNHHNSAMGLIPRGSTRPEQTRMARGPIRSSSRISDEEMARINIEASAALAEWIDIYRADPGGRQYTQLVDLWTGPSTICRYHPPTITAGFVAVHFDKGVLAARQILSVGPS